jgi:hypothetical protein
LDCSGQKILGTRSAFQSSGYPIGSQNAKPDLANSTSSSVCRAQDYRLDQTAPFNTAGSIKKHRRLQLRITADTPLAVGSLILVDSASKRRLKHRQTSAVAPGLFSCESTPRLDA